MARKLFFCLVILLLCVSVAIGTSGCSPQESPRQGETHSKEAPPSQKSAPPDKVVFNLHHLPDYPVYWAALDKGFWAEQNLDVKVIRGYGSTDTIAKIATKKAEFGLADIGALIMARAKEDIKVKAVANYQTYFPVLIFYHKSSGIKQPKDLEGKTIVSSPNSALRLFFPAFARATGIEQSKVQWKIVDMTLQKAVFVRGEADAWLQDNRTIPVLEKLGVPVQFFSFKQDANIDRYGLSIIVHEDTIAQNPDLVRRFVAGYLKGVRYCLEHPSEVGEILKKYVPETDANVAVKSWQIEVEQGTVVSDESLEKGLGWISRDKMTRTIDLSLDAYNIQKEIAPETVYTTEFLPEEPIYPPKK